MPGDEGWEAGVYVEQMKGLKSTASHGAGLGITLGRGHADTGSGLCLRHKVVKIYCLKALGASQMAFHGGGRREHV